MALNPNVQKYISTFIEAQFPRVYEQYGQPFINFVTAYYQWLETQGPGFDSRRVYDYQDIDTTNLDRFLIYFKNKYLPNIQLETVSNVKLLLKHSLDVYRSRGTIRSIDLLFRLVFGVGVDVYYPFDDVLQPSSGEWIIPLYIEVSTQDDLNKFVGKEIVGVTSGAQAFVESWVRKKSGSKQLDILYISVIEGNFQTGERINAANSPFNLLACPTIIGSLTEINVTSGGTGFEVGDILDIKGTVGYGATGRVANVSTTTGTVKFTLNDGGYGYMANSNILISDYVLSLDNVVPGQPSVTNNRNYFSVFEQIKQPMANILYQSANGGYFVNNDLIFTYYANGTQMGQGIVLSGANGVSTNGQLFVAILSGNLQSNTIYSSGNSKFATVPVSGGYTDKTASGNVIAESLSMTLHVQGLNGNFIQNEVIQNGLNTANGTLVSIITAGGLGDISIKNRVGIFQNTYVRGLTSGATANLTGKSMRVGVINVSGSFVGDARAPLAGVTSNTTATMSILNQGTGASFAFSNTLLYPETVSLNTDYLNGYVGTQIGAASYGFPANPSGNVSATIFSCLTVMNATIGSISSIVSQTPGVGYTAPPLARIYEKRTFSQQKYDGQRLTFTGATSSFQSNDIITQSATGARALVITANSSVITASKLSLFKTFVPTTNSTTTIVATATGTTANVVSIDDIAPVVDSEDIAQEYLGYNAVIEAETLAATGSVTSLQILSSGWGYEPGESVTATANGVTITGEAVLLKQGKGAGYYRTENGFLSDIKKIHDNDYYQVSAYDVRTAIAYEHYEDMLRSLLHVAGTKSFGTFVYRAEANVPLSVLKAKITQS